MNTAHSVEAAVRVTDVWVRHHRPQQDAMVVLYLGDEVLALAFGAGAQALQTALLPLGLRALSDQFFPAGQLNALSIERAITEVEDVVMPWHNKLPEGACLFGRDAAITQLAQWAGWPNQNAPWQLTTEAVEALFNRWVARAQGRPASQDELPMDGPFSAALLVLRECLHHLGFDGITVLPMAASDADAHGPAPSESHSWK